MGWETQRRARTAAGRRRGTLPADPNSLDRPDSRAPVARFLATLDGLSEVLRETLPTVALLDDPARALAEVLPAELLGPEPERVHAALRDLVGAIQQQRDLQPRSPGPARTQVDPNSFRESSRALIDALDGNAQMILLSLRRTLRIAGQRSRHQMMVATLLPAAVAAFESLLTRLIETHYRHHPQALRRDRTFNLGEIQQFDSISAVTERAISLTVDEIGRQSVGGWRKWFKDNVRCDFNDVCSDWPTVLEIFERRNVLVHHDGLISRQYQDRVSSAAPLGTRLPTDEEYVARSLDLLTGAGLAIGALTWQRSDKPEPDEVGRFVTLEIYELLKAERWAAVDEGTHALATLGDTGVAKPFILVNRWIARLNLYGSEAIRDEVEAFDVEELPPTFKLAKLVLLGHHEQGVRLLGELLESGSMSWLDAAEWPLLAPLRESDAWQRLPPLAKPLRRPGPSSD